MDFNIHWTSNCINRPHHGKDYSCKLLNQIIFFSNQATDILTTPNETIIFNVAPSKFV